MTDLLYCPKVAAMLAARMPQAEKSKQGVYRTFPERYPLRLSPEQKRRVERAAKAAGKTVANFLRDVVMARVAEDEADAESVRERRAAAGSPDGPVPRSRGLNLRSRTPVAPPEPPPAPTPTVIIQTAAPQATPPAEIALLADYVRAAGNSIDRQTRESRVQSMIQGLGRDQAEVERLAAALDAALAAGAPPKSGLSVETPSVVKSAWSYLTGLGGK